MKLRSVASAARSSTATATIGIAEHPSPPSEPTRRGRFAPTPSGPLHFGSLLAALAAWLDAGGGAGRCLLRIDDLDRPRCRLEYEQSILDALAAAGFRYPRPLLHQSERSDAYTAALRELGERVPLFHCDCSRRQLAAEAEPCCLADCRQRLKDPANSSLRADLRSLPALSAMDRSIGEIRFAPERHRDVVVRRRDGIVAYHLACVIDDAHQGITDIVRGADLFDSTAWQLALQRALGLATPSYLHLPVLVEADGQKLAKSRHSTPLDRQLAPQSLRTVLGWLKQESPPSDIRSAAGLLEFAEAHWDPARFRGLREIRLAPRH